MFDSDELLENKSIRIMRTISNIAEFIKAIIVSPTSVISLVLSVSQTYFKINIICITTNIAIIGISISIEQIDIEVIKVLIVIKP